ncbi:SWI/SNF-related matrix-associated actin-dependent regulator of chromatin subfamily D member 2 isoform X1 [Orcinus orca]|uniref:SWI/SNF-related matrix-associated actin-dependent regulator of chromatin subfamily D member 2 isoform X1 n=1 Tax=Orcinus orca TaxID=9733 RepID=UPI001441F624|nr:SWI/SNF-related matrix-associated actin-dependent regulator of chromatin subfamily D member 2 isoform X1 [Orcinus orca]XP_049558125.1 SWI/SNF-related matrix-associated actin-dependent regulator of chromatin subfamily D member 2 isoform X1 [Orcinus orca]
MGVAAVTVSLLPSHCTQPPGHDTAPRLLPQVGGRSGWECLVGPSESLRSALKLAGPREQGHSVLGPEGGWKWRWALKNSPRPFFSLQAGFSSHPWALQASFVGTAARAVEGGGAAVVYTSALRRLLPFVLGTPARAPRALPCAAQGWTWLSRGMEGMGYGPHRAPPLTCASPLPHFPQRPGMSPGSRMPMAGLQVGPPAGSPFGSAAPLRPGMPPTMMDPFRKRLLVPQAQPPMPAQRRGLKRRKMADKVLPQRIRELVPESQAYMDLLAFERKLDQTIARKRMEIQEAIKKPLTQKRKLRIYISNTFSPSKAEGDSAGTAGTPGGNPAGDKVASWELRVEGKLLDDPSKQKRKFSSFFKSLVIELDKELYGPDNHLVEWHRMPTTQETDGFQVKRPGDLNVKCTLLLMLDHQPPQYKLDPRLARLLGVHTQTRAAIMQALWLYIKHNQLQDGHEREYINCNRYFRQIFSCGRLRFSEIPMKLAGLLQHPDPIVINHVISVDPNDQKKTACYDIDVEVDDPLKAQMSNFLASTTNQQEIASLDVKIHETIESINQLKTQRDFMLSFSTDPQDFIQEWLRSQRRDLKIITDVIGNPEEERRAAFYHQPWAQEAVGRHIFAKVQQRRQELEQVLGIRLT